MKLGLGDRSSRLLAATLLIAAGAVARADDRLTLSGDLRLRHTVLANVGLRDVDPNADRTFQRYRLRLRADAALAGPVRATARLLWEGRHYAKPDGAAWPVSGFESWYGGALLFDLLALELKRPGGLPFDARVGRQEILLGDGWLVQDGTPIDGSRTGYFDAARLTFGAAAAGRTIDLVWLDQSADTGRFPRPLLGGTEDQLEQGERGAILWAHDERLVRRTKLDAYAIWKDARQNAAPGSVRVNNGAPFPSPSDSGEVVTLGGRAEAVPAAGWELKVEGAAQSGRRNGRDLRSFGVTGRVTRRFGRGREHRAHVGFEHLSGDDPASGRDEAFDPLWGRWPQWSELLIYQWPLDSRVGEATNVRRLGAGLLLQLGADSSLALDLHLLGADERSARYAAQAANLGGGRNRGLLATGRWRRAFDAHVSAHLHAEYFRPGDFYAAHRRDESYFARAELNLAF